MTKRMSKPTNKDRCLSVLRSASGGWVAGATLLKPDVGGSRFGARIEELRKLGHLIESSRDPGGSALFRYRLVEEAGNVPEPEPIRAAPVLWECTKCGERIAMISATTISDRYATGHCPRDGKAILQRA